MKKNQDISQYEEYKLILCALKIIGINKNGWCVEFGAGDGYDSSNTFNLINDNSFSSVQIEPNKTEFESLVKLYENRPDVHCFCEFVGIRMGEGLETILNRTDCPRDFDFLSIDIDGNDIYSWGAIRDYSAKLVLIEFNPSFPNNVAWQQPCDPSVQHGASLLATVTKAKELGYELIGVTKINALFCRAEYFPLFKMENNTLEALYNNDRYLTTVAQLYDGSLVLLGNKTLIWHRIEMDQNLMQVLPENLRTYQASINVRKIHSKRVMQRGDGVAELNSIPWYIQPS